MSSLIVEVVNIDNIDVHSNADNLEIATIKGWQCDVGVIDTNYNQSLYYMRVGSIMNMLNL